MNEPSSMLLPVLDAALRGILLALLVLLAARLLRDRPALPAAQAAVVLCLGSCLQVIGATPLFEVMVPVLWQAPFIAVSVANVVLFWVFVQALFDDDFRFQPVHGVAYGAVLLLSGLNCMAWAADGGATPLARVSLGLQRAVPLVFAALTALAAARHWRDDLVEERRRVRAFIVVMGVGYTLLMLTARLATARGRLSETMALIDAAVLLSIVAVAAWHFLRVGGSDLFPSAVAMPAVAKAPVATSGAIATEPVPTAPSDPAEERLAQALHRVMVEERAYRSEDLSVASLAGRLSVPEYRLRRLINQRLGHRNFNVYVNAFRLADARLALADPQQRALPVLTIALEAGFQSIGPFNRAFKAATGLTPTEFRRENSADS